MTDPSPAPPRFAAGAATVAVAAGLLSLNRFGGLAGTAPRAFTRLALVVVWGWVGLCAFVWLTDGRTWRQGSKRSHLVRTLDAVGRAHLSLIGLAAVLFVAAGALRLRWPGLVAAVVVFGWFFPRSIVAWAADVRGVSLARATVAVAPAYVVWVVTVGRHLQVQLGHLI